MPVVVEVGVDVASAVEHGREARAQGRRPGAAVRAVVRLVERVRAVEPDIRPVSGQLERMCGQQVVDAQRGAVAAQHVRTRRRATMTVRGAPPPSASSMARRSRNSSRRSTLRFHRGGNWTSVGPRCAPRRSRGRGGSATRTRHRSASLRCDPKAPSLTRRRSRLAAPPSLPPPPAWAVGRTSSSARPCRTAAGSTRTSGVAEGRAGYTTPRQSLYDHPEQPTRSSPEATSD